MIFRTCYKGETEDQTIKEAQENKCDIVGQIMEEMMSDDENDTERLLFAYENATEEERAIMDYVLVCLCGYTMNTIIEHAKEYKNFLEE